MHRGLLGSAWAPARIRTQWYRSASRGETGRFHFRVNNLHLLNARKAPGFVLLSQSFRRNGGAPGASRVITPEYAARCHQPPLPPPPLPVPRPPRTPR